MNKQRDTDPVVRILRKALAVSRDTFPDLVTGLAADGEVSVLQSVIDSGFLPSEQSPMTSRLFASVLALRGSGAAPADVEALTNAWAKALDVKTDPQSLAYHLRFVESAEHAQGLLDLGGDPTYATGKDQVKTSPLLAQISRRAHTVVDLMLATAHDRGVLPICSYTENLDGTRSNVRTAFHHFAERIGSGDGDIEEFVLERVSGRGISLEWQQEVGRGITEIFLAGHMSTTRLGLNRAFLYMLALARFELPDLWLKLISGKSGCMKDVIDPKRDAGVTLGVLRQAAADGVSPDRILIPCRHEGNSYELPLLVAATMRNNADIVKCCLELGADSLQRLPAPGASGDLPYSGKDVLEYAVEIDSRDVASVLASWRAKSAVMSVVARKAP